MFLKIGNASLEGQNCNLYIDSNEGNLCFYLKKDQSAIYTKIKNLALPINVNTLSSNHLSHFFKNTYMKLVQLDENYKLYVCLKLLGGGKDLITVLEQEPKLTNKEIAELVIENNIPENTFTSVEVSNTSFNFGGTGFKEARVIILRPGTGGFEVFLLQIKKFIIGSKKLTKGFLNNAIGNLILKGDDNEEGKMALKRAYDDQRAVYVYFSNDHKSIECKVEDIKGMCVIY